MINDKWARGINSFLTYRRFFKSFNQEARRVGALIVLKRSGLVGLIFRSYTELLNFKYTSRKLMTLRLDSTVVYKPNFLKKVWTTLQNLSVFYGLRKSSMK